MAKQIWYILIVLCHLKCGDKWNACSKNEALFTFKSISSIELYSAKCCLMEHTRTQIEHVFNRSILEDPTLTSNAVQLLKRTIDKVKTSHCRTNVID